MNSVHEPGSRTMSKNRLRNSTESNRAKNRLSAPNAQPTGLAARPGRAPCRAPRALRLPVAPLPPAARVPGPSACLPAPHAQPRSARPSAPRAPTCAPRAYLPSARSPRAPVSLALAPTCAPSPAQRPTTL